MKKLTSIIVITLLVSILSGCSLDKKSNSSNEVVNTAYGDVKGQVKDDVTIFYGIPYAKNPTGNLRWEYPEEPEKWNDVLDCTEKEEIAIQMATTYDESGKPSVNLQGTTDCLNLDVYTKSNSENLPVIVYIHGGNNQSGSSFEIPGADIVKQNDVVYVSVNYRLGLLGFNNLPAILDENESGNFGLMDIKESLKWIKNNIKNFGGDPNNITISGFSAGGRDVMATLISPEFEGLYEKAIVYSGGMTVADEKSSQEFAAKTIAPLVVEDGIVDNENTATEWLLQDTEEVSDYLMGLDEKRIVSLLSDAGIRMENFPHLFADGITIPKDGFDAEYKQDVPIIMVTGTDEFSLFASGANYETYGDEKEKAKEFAIKYGSDFYRVFNTYLSAEKMSEKGYKSDIYLGQINYGGINSEIKINGIGSFHGVFAPFLSKENGYTSLYDFTEEKYQSLAKIFNSFIKEFVYTGSPNSGEGEYTWEAWKNTKESSLIFDANKTEVIIKNEDTSKSNEVIIQELINDSSISNKTKDDIIKNILNGRWFSKDLDNYFSN